MRLREMDEEIGNHFNYHSRGPREKHHQVNRDRNGTSPSL